MTKVTNVTARPLQLATYRLAISISHVSMLTFDKNQVAEDQFYLRLAALLLLLMFILQCYHHCSCRGTLQSLNLKPLHSSMLWNATKMPYCTTGNVIFLQQKIMVLAITNILMY